jgi:hypothetical protein
MGSIHSGIEEPRCAIASTGHGRSASKGAFDKEPLTRDFFKRFDDALEAIKADLE